MVSERTESNRMRTTRLILGFALLVGTTIAFAQPPAGRGRGAPPPPAGPIGRLPDGHPDMQGFWTPPAITDIEPAQGRGGRGPARGPAPAAPPPAAAPAAPPANAGLAASGFGGAGATIDTPDRKIPYKPEARA